MFKRILVPVDFTKKNLAAIDAAAKLALQNHSKVTLLHVIERIDLIPARELETFYKELERTATAKMKGFAKRFSAKSISPEQKIIYGNRTTEIVQYAAKARMDLIVLSSHRIDTQYPVLNWGTISYRVAVLSQCPILLVK